MTDPSTIRVGDTLYQAYTGHEDATPAIIEADVVKAGPVELTLHEPGHSTTDRIPRLSVDDPRAWSNWSTTPELAKRTLAVRLRRELTHQEAKTEATRERLAAVVEAWPEVAEVAS